MDFVTSYFLKDEPLTSWTLFSTYLSSNLDSSSPIFWLEEHLIPSIALIRRDSNIDDQYVEKSVQLVRGSSFQMTCYKIHTFVKWSWYTSTYLYSPSGAPWRFMVSMTTVLELEEGKVEFSIVSPDSGRVSLTQSIS